METILVILGGQMLLLHIEHFPHHIVNYTYALTMR